jgi:acyl-CoA synthetase (AMP-forming)/AMP-acid ligase II
LAIAAAGRFLRTGDLGFVIGGELFIAGRIKDVMIVRGHNYYPQDIERMAETTHPSLRKGSSAAFVVAESGRQEIVLVQEVERTHRRSFDYWQAVAAIRQAVHEEFELTLTKVILVQPGSIPKTSSGKIKRAETRQLYLAGALEQIGSNAATGT